jgi:hypothetical protein
LPFYHGIEGVWACAVVNDQTKLIFRGFWNDVDRHNIHTWKEGVEWLGETFSFHFLVALGYHEIMMPVIPWRVLGFIVSDRVSVLRFGPRPKTFAQANENRLHERLIGVVLKKFGKSANINITCNFEEIGIVMDCFIGCNVIELRGRWTRERVCEKGVSSSGTDGVDHSSPN